MLIIISDKTKTNITQIYDYIANNSIKYAQSPYLGRYVSEVKDKRLREILYKSYRIVYTISEETNTIYIHFVVHGKMDFQTFYNSYISKNDV